jgi:hypothetical protein
MEGHVERRKRDERKERKNLANFLTKREKIFFKKRQKK